MNGDVPGETADTYWLLRWEASREKVDARVRKLGGRLLDRRRDDAWRIRFPASVNADVRDFGPGVQLEPEVSVERVRRPLNASTHVDLTAPHQCRLKVIDRELAAPIEKVTVILHGRSGLTYRALSEKDGTVLLGTHETNFDRLELLPADAYWPRLVRHGLSGIAGGELELEMEPISQRVEPYGWGATRAMKIDRVHALGHRGKGVRIAVLDTGVSPHPDLEIHGGVNTADLEAGDLWQDTHWHGTHVAGICTALGRPGSLVGVAPEAELHAVRVGKVVGEDENAFSNEMFETDLLEGIQWCLDNDIEVLNMSLYSRETRALDEIIKEAYARGVVMVAPSGNQKIRGKGWDTSGVDYPACHPHVISVGAVGRRGTYPADSFFGTAESGARFSSRFTDYYVPGFSKYGQGLDFLAPGVAILSTVPGTLKGWDIDNTRLTGYTSWMGTSQAAPYITGLVALLLGSRHELRRIRDGRKVDTIRELLRKGSISLDLDPLYQGAGLPFGPACLEETPGLD